MPSLERPDGIQLHWQEVGEGPVVLVANTYYNYPGLYAGLVEELARDHRVVEYDLRGNGRSTRTGPYDLDTDTHDLIALGEALGGVTVAVCTGDGVDRAVRAAAARPDLFPTVVSPAGAPLPRDAYKAGSGLVSSDAVIEGILRLTENDYRAALRTIVESANSEATQQEVRERMERTLEYCPQQAALARARAWVDADSSSEARALGDRLWLLMADTNPWFPMSTLDLFRELLPEAHVQGVEGGPMRRPDITAEVVRRLTGAA
jgi:pimeloyl-ACP methyl ester carboxylesterase